jgi:hypothetical protein
MTVCPPAGAQLDQEYLSGSPFNFGIAGGIPANQIQAPAGAVYAAFAGDPGVSAASPGTYGSAMGACGRVGLCITFPPPPGLDCGDASCNYGNCNCPPGCAPAGPWPQFTCQPKGQYTCYAASAATDCGTQKSPQTPAGSWTLDLSSVVFYGDAGPNQEYTVHGTFTATMVEVDAAASTATLTVSF